jgi:DNA-binding transcriptional regulator YdaS (Cro superfamily)
VPLFLDFFEWALTRRINSAYNQRIMTLSDYLSTTTQAELAGRLGVSQSMVSQWLTGISRITAERALDIERATQGQVTRHDLRPDIFGQPQQKAAA